MSDLKDLTEKIRKFRDDRDWMRYHSNKNMAMSIMIEAAELLEHFQWDSKNTDEYVQKHKDDIGEELADVVIYLLELADNLGIDVKEAVEKKLEENAKKYPVGKIKGSDKKYTQI